MLRHGKFYGRYAGRRGCSGGIAALRHRSELASTYGALCERIYHHLKEDVEEQGKFYDGTLGNNKLGLWQTFGCFCFIHSMALEGLFFYVFIFGI